MCPVTTVQCVMCGVWYRAGAFHQPVPAQVVHRWLGKPWCSVTTGNRRPPPPATCPTGTALLHRATGLPVSIGLPVWTGLPFWTGLPVPHISAVTRLFSEIRQVYCLSHVLLAASQVQCVRLGSVSWHREEVCRLFCSHYQLVDCLPKTFHTKNVGFFVIKQINVFFSSDIYQETSKRFVYMCPCVSCFRQHGLLVASSLV